MAYDNLHVGDYIALTEEGRKIVPLGVQRWINTGKCKVIQINSFNFYVTAPKGENFWSLGYTNAYRPRSRNLNELVK